MSRKTDPNRKTRRAKVARKKVLARRTELQRSRSGKSFYWNGKRIEGDVLNSIVMKTEAELAAMTPEQQEEYAANCLLNNLKLLKSLENDFCQEQLAQKEVQERLAAQGCDTLEAKVEVLKKEWSSKVNEVLEDFQENVA